MNLLLVEPNSVVGEKLRQSLERQDYAVNVVEDGDEALAWVKRHTTDLVILDSNPTCLDSLAVCRELRHADFYAPIIAILDRESIGERVGGFFAGASEYLFRPFAFGDLLMRIDSLLANDPQEHLISSWSGEHCLELDGRQAFVDRKYLDLPDQEYKVLELLVGHPGKVFSSKRLAELAWNRDLGGTYGVVVTCIANLRRKFQEVGLSPLEIRTVRGRGYAWEKYR